VHLVEEALQIAGTRGDVARQRPGRDRRAQPVREQFGGALIVEGGAALLAGGGEVGAEREEVVGAGAGAPSAWSSSSRRSQAAVALDEVVVERDVEVVGEAQDVFAVAVQAAEQVARRGLGDEPALAGADGVEVLTRLGAHDPWMPQAAGP
jgi:hypothetical protein